MNKDDSRAKAIKEIATRLDNYPKLYEFVLELAAWDGITDSWYNTLIEYQRKAREVLNNIDDNCYRKD